MTWFGRVESLRFHPVFGMYARSRLTSPEYPVPVTTDSLYLDDYPKHIQSRMQPGWRFRWTITKDVDTLEARPLD